MATANVARRVLGNTSVSRKILASVSVAVVSGVAVGTVGAVALHHAADVARATYAQSTQGLIQVEEMRSQLLSLQLDQAMAYIQADPALKQSFTQAGSDAAAAVAAAADTYVNKTSPSAEQSPLAEKLLADYGAWGDLNTQVQQAVVNGDMASAGALNQQAVAALPAVEQDIQDLLTSETKEAARSADDVASTESSARLVLILVLVVGSLVALGLGWTVARGITRSLLRVKHVAQGLADGDLTRRTGIDQNDEVGQMAGALDAAQATLADVMVAVVASADAVAASSEQLSASSAQISASAEETSAQSGVVSSAADEVSRSVQTVAAGAEQMGASIREIASNAAEASDVAARAVTAAETTTATVAKLGDSSAEIGNVVKVITSIAEQTNLLALNATIEAARAGEAGKGFAVVANEVKELAQETAKATEDIARRVQSIQGDTTAAVAAIEEISSIVAQISDRQTTIASAVEEQTATTSEMSRSVQEAANGTTEIATNITGVSTAAASTTQALGQTRTAVDELSRMAGDLRTTVGRFTY